jgi:ribosomal protein S18 acetylase RimI-like enzyme
MPMPMSSHRPIAFRSAGLGDRDALIDLVTSAYRGESSRAGWTTEADLLEGPRIAPEVLEQDLRRPRSRVVVVDGEDGALLACAHVCDEGGSGYFGMFAVAPGRQGGGIGDALLRECERIAREEWGLAVMRMTVIDLREELIAWYERRGYRRTGIHNPFPYGDERFGRPRREDLRFAVLEKAL